MGHIAYYHFNIIIQFAIRSPKTFLLFRFSTTRQCKPEQSITKTLQPKLPRKCASLDVSLPYRPPRPVTRLAIFYLKAIPVTGLGGLKGCEMEVRLSALRTGRAPLPRKHYFYVSGTHFS
jgi:hypothetical protein